MLSMASLSQAEVAAMIASLLALVLLPCALSKVFSRCELARELSLPKHRIPPAEVATWVCIARHESEYNTSAVGHLNADGSGDHGLFQISDQYWCSPPGVGLACGLNCDQLEDDDIKDDVVCARRIYRAHKRRTGDGFTAWAVYGFHCRGDVSAYTDGCDEEESTSTTESPWSRTSTTTESPYEESSSTTEHIEEYYEEPSVSSEDPTSESPDVLLKKQQTSLVPPKTSQPQSRLFPSRYQNTIDPSDPVVKDRATSARSRIAGTSSDRPTFTNLDPATAWLQIHNHPRFLDQFP